MPSYYIETFGCQMNVADSDMLAGLLAARGYEPARDAFEAGLVVVNTCSVRENAEKRALARIGEYAGHKKANDRGQTLWVVGCMAERMGESLKERIPGVDMVIGATRIEQLIHDIDSYLGMAAKRGNESQNHSQDVSAFLSVMRGCDNFCSYCIVPYVRGREHSIEAAALLSQAESLVKRGVKEITLLGQNVNSYNDGSVDFVELIRKMHDVKGLERIRFTTSHPKDCSEKLIETIAKLPRVCKHIHLPVQSGSSAVLEKMNRGYSREDYLRLVERIFELVPKVDLTTDVMVGFPGESEEDYQKTLSLFEKVRFTTAFMFAYSAREGTRAARMENQVEQSVKKRRLEELINLQTKITREKYSSMVGEKLEVLFTMRQQKRGRGWMGRDIGCKRVLLHCDETLTGTILPVRIKKSSGMTLIAERC